MHVMSHEVFAIESKDRNPLHKFGVPARGKNNGEIPPLQNPL